MPMELRKIVFTAEEMQGAAYGYCLHVGKPMPDAVVKDMVIEGEPELAVSLVFDVNHPHDRKEVRLARGEVAAALIRYCRRIGVPIPRNAKKGVHPHEDGIVMMINLNYQTTPAASAA